MYDREVVQRGEQRKTSLGFSGGNESYRPGLTRMGTMRSGRGYLSMDKVKQVLGPSMGSLHLLLRP